MYHRIDWDSSASTHVFKLLLWTVIFGWHGNCVTRALQFERIEHVYKITYRSLNHLETEVWVSLKWPFRVSWNCEWIAMKWGHYQEDGRGRDWYDYTGLLGYHISL